MCRFTLYLGPPVKLSALLLDPAHSLIRQSTHSAEREEPLNGDGFGVGWYARDLAGEPAVFRSITPAWNNRNLRNLARVVASDCILAHVRAATQASGVNEANCHPFRYRELLFMHNGDVGNFRRVRRELLAGVCDEAFGNVYGSTDSEHFFAVLIDEMLKDTGSMAGAERLAVAMERAIWRVTQIVEEHGDGEPSYLNCAVADGDSAVISRFTNDSVHGPETLYYFVGQLYPDVADSGESMAEPLIVSSERLTNDPGWQVIPPNHLVLLTRGQAPQLRAMADQGRSRRKGAPTPASATSRHRSA